MLAEVDWMVSHRGQMCPPYQGWDVEVQRKIRETETWEKVSSTLGGGGKKIEFHADTARGG